MKYALALAALLLSGCVDTTPRTRIHSVASVPRFVDINNFTFEEDKLEGKSGIGANFGAGMGTAWSDVGNVHGAQIYHAGIHLRGKGFAVGWMPYFAAAQVTHEGTKGFGSTLWGSVSFGGGGDWRFSYQNSFSLMTKVAEDQGCQKDDIFFGCTAQQKYQTRSEVVIRDVGFVLTAEKHVGARNSVLVAPALHWTYLAASSQLDVDPANDYVRRTTFWSPSFQVGYVTRFGDVQIKGLKLRSGTAVPAVAGSSAPAAQSAETK